MKISIIGITEAQQTILDVPERTARLAILEMSQIAYDATLAGADRHHKKGQLRASVFNRKVAGLTREVGHDLNHAPHALFVLFGTKAHDIVPKEKKALRWVAGNGYVFARLVHHPGTRADNYLERAADEAVRQLPAIIDRAFKDTPL